MGMDLEYGPGPAPAPAPAGPRLHRRILEEMGRRIGETYRYDTLLWRSALAGLWIICFLAFTIVMLGIPTGFGIPADIALAAAAGTIVLALAGNILAVLLALTGLRIPRLFAGCIITVLGIILLILYYSNLELEAAAFVAVLVTLLGTLAGLAFGLLRSRRIAMGFLLAAMLTLSPLALASGGQEETQVTGTTSLKGNVVQLAAGNPGLPGPYAYHSFTYASGLDLHRTEYGEEADLLSSTVDASAYIKKWPKLRSLIWGFNQTSLPLNGRVWMPDGEGPYPLILMVHGNHMMEDYSDGGYDYLGKLLASRGFIAVSLDQNFLNYSAWSGIPDNDFKVRAWMILKHLEQLENYSKQTGNPFYQKIDFTQTALLGHSRGGQAVAMAADAGRWFKGDSLLAVTRKFHITSVIALAPTDKPIDGQQARLSDVNYLTLQGARDGDVHDFYGDRQYIRSSYSRGSTAFKSSLYIADANHSQFNSDWGLLDQSLPTGLFLSRSGIMNDEEQRQIAKVYVSAFLETTLNGNNVYTGLFRDYRTGLEWLPHTSYYSRYQSGGFRQVVNFDEDRDKNTAGRGSTAEGQGLKWTEELAKDRESKSKGTYGLVLERTALEDAEAAYTIHLQNDAVNNAALAGAAGISFSMSNLKENTSAEGEGTSLPPGIEIGLTDSNHITARLPLADVMEILPLPRTWFTLTPWLEERISDNKYGDLSEAVFQTYELPFERFQKEETAFDPAKITGITFYLEEAGDKIMLDDVGFYDDDGNE
ncbi:alpha/beta hydrolase [Paenibacillus sp. BR2-3]|uniref:alpha/beta hydrolase family protein n=1 Tax=Paenibacillus sp. BR2-3 TaxID=3048494 RepID=UPI0039777496